jgi:hypothetical protein
MANKSKDKKYHFLYKTTNLLNKKVYYGIHSTNNLEDGYLGSGSYFYRSLKKYGKENFKREILKFFDNREALVKAERELVTEDLVKDTNCYNVQVGGEGWNSINTIPVVDNNGNNFRVHRDDPRYLNGELKFNLNGMINTRDANGNFFKVKQDDPRYLSGELVSDLLGKAIVKDGNGKKFYIHTDDQRYLSGEFVGCTKGTATVKDKNGNYFKVDLNDPRYLSGELVHNWSGRKHKEETKRKIGKANSIKQSGSANSQYGKVWVYHLEKEKNIKILEDELESYLKTGWIRGRKMHFNK